MAKATKRRPSPDMKTVGLAVVDEKIGVDVYAQTLAPEDVPPVVLKAAAMKKALDRLVKLLEARIGVEELAANGRWVDEETGQVFSWEGEPGDWKVADPEGLIDAMRLVGISEPAIAKAMPKAYKPDHAELNILAKANDRWAEAINGFRARGIGPKHLKEKV